MEMSTFADIGTYSTFGTYSNLQIASTKLQLNLYDGEASGESILMNENQIT